MSSSQSKSPACQSHSGVNPKVSTWQNAFSCSGALPRSHPRTNPAASRNQIHQPAKLQRDRREIGINIRVIEFERSENQFVRMVVQKFRPVIEECGIVFVAFDDEFFAAAEPVAAIAKIRGHAANQKIGTPPGDLKNPGEHRGGGGFAVGARDDDRRCGRE